METQKHIDSLRSELPWLGLEAATNLVALAKKIADEIVDNETADERRIRLAICSSDERFEAFKKLMKARAL